MGKVWLGPIALVVSLVRARWWESRRKEDFHFRRRRRVRKWVGVEMGVGADVVFLGWAFVVVLVVDMVDR